MRVLTDPEGERQNATFFEMVIRVNRGSTRSREGINVDEATAPASFVGFGILRRTRALNLCRRSRSDRVYGASDGSQ